MKTFFALGTINTIQVPGCTESKAIDLAIDRVYEIHNQMSAYQEGSDVCRLNASAGKGPKEMHPDTFYLLKLAKEYSGLSKGAFDITIRPLSALWNIGKKGDFIPDDKDVRKALDKTGYQYLSVHPGGLSAQLIRPGMGVDLGGIAKGYAGDEVKRILSENGVQNALINLGGNIVAMGKKPDGPWTVGVQNPLRPRGESLLSLTIQNQCVVTSGSYERFFIKDGIRYHHILDPKTGFPAQSGLLSVTVVSPSGVDADALSTALFVMGRESPAAAAMLAGTGAQAVYVTDNMEVFYSHGPKAVQ